MLLDDYAEYPGVEPDLEPGLFREQAAPRLRRRILSAPGRIAVLLVSDVCALVTALSIGYALWAGPVLAASPGGYIPVLPLLALFPLTYAVAGLYPGFGLGAVETIRRLFNCTNASCLLITAASFALKAGPVYSRMTFALAWIAALILVPLVRFVTLAMVRDMRWWGEPTVVVGSLQEASLTIRCLREAFSLGYRVVGVVSPEACAHSVENVRVLGGLEVIPRLGGAGVNTVLLWDGPGLAKAFQQLQRQFRHLVMIRDARSLPLEQVRVRNLGGVMGIEFTNELLDRRNQAIKRALDLVLGGALLIGSAPLLALSMVAVALTSRGPIFFSQEREGLHGEKLRVRKLRTMRHDAEQRLADLLHKDPRMRSEWEHNLKLVNDPRIIPVLGTLLRRFSIDELPQLLGVVTGKLSLVGPRPLPEYHLNKFQPDFRELRRSVRPGLTGMWQVMIRSDRNLQMQELYDTYYILNWSLWLDIYILVRTILAVLGGRGAR